MGLKMAQRDENGRFLPGHKLATGRPPGSRNVISPEKRSVFMELIQGSKEEFLERVHRLDDKTFCSVYLQAAEYVLPKLSRTESIVQAEGEIEIRWEEIPLKERRTLMQSLLAAKVDAKAG